MKPRPSPVRQFLLALLLAAAPALAEQPLSLEDALATADGQHPVEALARAELEQAEGDLLAARGETDVKLNIWGRLGRVKPSIPALGYDSVSDNWLYARAHVTVYDFGRNDSLIDAARAERDARQVRLLDAGARHRLLVMQRYLEVLVADMQAQIDDEYMAVAYVDWDNSRDRLEVGLIGPVEFARLESSYRDFLERRNLSQQAMRISRQRLANAMNQPEQLPAELALPRFSGLDREPLDFGVLMEQAEQHNRELLALRRQMEAARARMAAVRAERLPRLEVEAHVANYQRELSGRDDERLGLLLHWPIWDGRVQDGRLGSEQGSLYRVQAAEAQARMDLREELLDLLVHIRELQGTRRIAAETGLRYRNLALERARGEYEMELKTNLGTSMAAALEAELRMKQIDWRLALAFERLSALVGLPVEQLTRVPGNEDETS